MILEYLGLPYEETHYDDTNGDQWFNSIKPKLSEKNPAITLPYLIDGETVISESDGIIVYIIHKAKKTELLGRNADEQTRIATTMGVLRDLHSKYIGFAYGRNHGDLPFEEAKAAYQLLAEPYLVKLNKLLEGREYFAGQITWVDFVVSEVVQCLWLLQSDVIEKYTNLFEHQKRVWNLPALSAYHQSDRFR